MRAVLIMVAVLCTCSCSSRRPLTDADLARTMPVWIQKRTPLVQNNKPFLWVVERTPPSFLFGTIHLPDDRVLSLPKVVDLALEASNVVCTEVHGDAGTLQAMGAMYLLPDGQSIKDVVPARLYGRIEAYFESKGYSMRSFKKQKPWSLMFQIQLVDYLMQGKNALDFMLYQRAVGMGLEPDAFETLDDHIAFFDELPPGEQVQMLRRTLDAYEEGERRGDPVTERLLRAYLQGDGQGLIEAFEASSGPNDYIYEKFMSVILLDRNETMLAGMKKRFEDHPDKSYFFAVGAMHFIGDDGIVAEMRRQGYSVRRLTAADVDLFQ